MYALVVVYRLSAKVHRVARGTHYPSTYQTIFIKELIQKELSKRDIVGTEQHAKVAGVLKFRPSLACIALIGQYLGAYYQ